MIFGIQTRKQKIWERMDKVAKENRKRERERELEQQRELVVFWVKTFDWVFNISAIVSVLLFSINLLRIDETPNLVAGDRIITFTHQLISHVGVAGTVFAIIAFTASVIAGHIGRDYSRKFDRHYTELDSLRKVAIRDPIITFFAAFLTVIIMGGAWFYAGQQALIDNLKEGNLFTVSSVTYDKQNNTVITIKDGGSTGLDVSPGSYIVTEVKRKTVLTLDSQPREASPQQTNSDLEPSNKFR